MDTLNGALLKEKNYPSPILNSVAPLMKYKTSILGCRNDNFHTHVIYHYDVDENSFLTTHVKFASPYVTQWYAKTFGNQLVKDLRKKYLDVEDDPYQRQSEKVFAYEEFVIGCFIYSKYLSNICGKIVVERGETNDDEELACFGRSGMRLWSKQSSANGMKEEIEEVLEHYPNHCIVIQPAEKISALDFIVVDTQKNLQKFPFSKLPLHKTM